MHRMNVLAVDRQVSGRSEVLLLTLIPLLTFGMVCAITGIYGVAYRPGCNSARNFIANLLFQPTTPSTCKSVPFLSDMPTMMLAVTSPFALVVYRLLRRRIAQLLGALGGTGLIRVSDDSEPIKKSIERLERAVDMNRTMRFGIFVISTMMVTWLYSRNLANGHLFNTLGVGEDGESNAESLRHTWWANYHHHPLLACVCIFIGSVGVAYAIRAGWLYTWLGVVLYAAWRRKIHMNNLPVEYVPRWRDKSYGWSPVTGALMLIYISTISYAVSMVAVFDMLRNESETLDVAIGFAILGVVTNLLIILTSFIMIMAVHRAVAGRLREKLMDVTSMTPGEYAVAANELSSWRKIPVASFSGSIIKILPGLYALFEFIRTFTGAKHN